MPVAELTVAQPASVPPLVQRLERRSLWFGSGLVVVQENLTLIQAWRLGTLASLEGVGQIAIWRSPAREEDLLDAGLDPACVSSALSGWTAESRPALAAFDDGGRLIARYKIDWPASEQPGLLAVCASRVPDGDLASEPAPGSVLRRAVDWVRRTSAAGADDRLAVRALGEFREGLAACPTSLDAIARLAAEPGVSRMALATNGAWDSASMTLLGMPAWVSMDMIATHGWSAKNVRQLVWIWGPRWRRLVILPAERSDVWPADVASILVRVD